MENFKKQYQIAQKNSIQFMKRGQINAYFDALLTMDTYKKLMIAVIPNKR